MTKWLIGNTLYYVYKVVRYIELLGTRVYTTLPLTTYCCPAYGVSSEHGRRGLRVSGEAAGRPTTVLKSVLRPTPRLRRSLRPPSPHQPIDLRPDPERVHHKDSRTSLVTSNGPILTKFWCKLPYEGFRLRVLYHKQPPLALGTPPLGRPPRPHHDHLINQKREWI